MINEKNLSLFLEGYNEEIRSSDLSDEIKAKAHDGVKEVTRLARLGLWAKSHGIPTLNKIIDDPGFDVENAEAAITLRMNLLAHKALKAIKKGE